MNNMYIVATPGFLNEIPQEKQAIIFTLTTNQITPKCDFFVFDPNTTKTKIEYQDDGRTMYFPMKTIPKKVYAKLDDYGSKEALSDSVGHRVQTRYTLTFMLAEDY